MIWNDLRNTDALASGQPQILVREAKVLAAGDDPTPPPGTLRQRIFAGADELFSWFRTSQPDAGLDGLAVLVRWDSLSAADKRQAYGELACHEVDLWLLRHDPAFFANVVKPQLGQLFQPDLINTALAGGDLAPWCEPYRLQQMHAAELAILGRARPAMAERVQRMLADRCAGSDERWHEADALRRAALALDARSVPAPTALKPVPVEPPTVKVDAPVLAETEQTDANALDVETEPTPALEIRPEILPPEARTDRIWWMVSRGELSPDLIPASRFWRELAATPPTKALLSPAVLAVGGHRAAMVTAIALSDLPLHAPTADLHGRLPSNALLVRERMQRVAITPHEGLVADAAVFAENSTLPAQPPLTAWQPYRLCWRLVDMSGRRRTLDVLAEIPAGAVALNGSKRLTTTITLDPYASATFDLPFFLTGPGTYPCFGLHVAEDGRLVASGSLPDITIAKPGSEDGRWWLGSDEMILARLRSQSGDLLAADLNLLELADPVWWRQVCEVLETRGTYDVTVLSWALAHRDLARFRQWLRLDGSVVKSVGGAIRSPLLDLVPLVDLDFIHLDIERVVNPRWHHPAGSMPQNGLVASRWRTVLEYAARLSRLDDAMELEIAYLLLLQDRHVEAATWLARVAPAAPWTTQLAYAGAWLALSRGDAANAARAAGPLLTMDLVQPWAGRRDALVSHLAALGVLPAQPGTTAKNSFDRALERAAAAPSVQGELDGAGVKVQTRDLTGGEVRLYTVDLEARFIAKPFDQQAPTVPMMTAGAVIPFTAAADGSVIRVPFPEAMARRSLIVVIAGGGIEQVLSYSGAALDLRIAATDGLLQVLDREGRPVSAAYVRVHGEQGFVRDGRTDLLGRFDLRATPSTPLRLAIYVESASFGSTTRIIEGR